MRVIADFHIHGPYSMATSERMCIAEIARFAKIKGLNIVGTGDFTHPKWLNELTQNLVLDEETCLYRPASDATSSVSFIVATEVSTVFPHGNETKKVHHVILTPNFETAAQINERLSLYGNLQVDGRPTLNVTPPTLVEEVMEVSIDNMVFPAHAWTPWFSIFGAFSGFDSVEECYQDMTKHIHALETGLSCYDRETQVLTAEGWKDFDEVDYDDRICTLNIENNEIQFQKPLGIHVYQHKGHMYKLKTNRVDLLVTPNHKILYSPCDFRRPPRLVLKEAERLFKKSKRFKKDGVWKGKKPEYFNLPAVKIRHGSRYYSGLRQQNERKLPLKAWLKFFGFWIAEGWTTESERGEYDVCVSNKNAALLSEMNQILQNLGFNTFLNKKTGTLRVRDYQMCHYLKKFGKCNEKFVPNEIKVLSKENLELFLEYYIKGDGHIYGRNGKGLSATTTSIRLRDDLQEIALKMGISAYYKLGRKKGTTLRGLSGCRKIYKQREDAWVVYFIRKNLHTVLPSTIQKYNHIESWVDFEGSVFCVTVPNHVIYVRRNGIPIWCGNSDPPMNWRLSKLDKFTLLSNSDSHSFWPWRIGREANVFELGKPSYKEITELIRLKDKKRFKFTIETDPAYGKYHWTGHRHCNVALSAREARKFANICPVCRRKLTKGVEQRVDELADRAEGFVPTNSIDFVRLQPLSEIISTVLRSDSPAAQKVWNVYNALIEKFGNEYNVLIDASRQQLVPVAGEVIADTIIKVRDGKANVVPGYDGVYGQLVVSDAGSIIKSRPKSVQQSNLTDFT